MLLQHGADAKAKTYDDFTILGMIASVLLLSKLHRASLAICVT